MINISRIGLILVSIALILTFSAFVSDVKGTGMTSRLSVTTTVYDYKDDSSHEITTTIPRSTLDEMENEWALRQDVSYRNPEIVRVLERLMSEHWVSSLADELREISGPLDEELFANLVLQVVHQLRYEGAVKGKYPAQTLFEKSGDCDSLSILGASLMKAGGLDSAVIITPVPQAGECGLVGYRSHAVIGVRLPFLPDDNDREIFWFNHDSKRYYIAEATWGESFSVASISGPNSYERYADLDGSLVGDNPLRGEEKLIACTYEAARTASCDKFY